MLALLLAVFTIMVIVEMKSPGCVARLYGESIKREERQGEKEKRPKASNLDAHPHMSTNAFGNKPRRPKAMGTEPLNGRDRPLLNIKNATVLRGGWQSHGRHGTVREGVWFDEEGRAWKVAIKSAIDVKDKACVEAINKECDALTKMPHHPNIVWVIGGRMGDDPMIVEELMATNLAGLLRESRPGLTYREILKIGLDVAKGMCHLHEHGLTHFDITPSSILLDQAHNAMLAGFSKSRHSKVSTIYAASDGTPGYMAPECLRAAIADDGLTMRNLNTAQSDAERIDVYGLGKVLLKCVTSSLNVENAVAERLCPEPLWKFICWCVQTHPDNRPGCEQVVQGLRVMLEGSQIGLDDWRSRRPKADIWRIAR